MFQIGEIVWGRMRGFPWWPARIVTPTPQQLKHLSVTKIPPDHRLVWFFNDNDRYSLLNVKCLSPFSNTQLTTQTKKKTGKSANKLKLAFNQATEQHRSTENLQTHQSVQTPLVSPIRNTNSLKQPTDSLRKVTSKRTTTRKRPQSPRHHSHSLSSRTTAAPSNPSSHQTNSHLPSAKPPSTSIPLRLRIKHPHSLKTESPSRKPPIPSSSPHRNHTHHRSRSITSNPIASNKSRRQFLGASQHPNPVKTLQTESAHLNHNHLPNTHSTSNPERSRRVTKPSLKLRDEPPTQDEHPLKKRKRQTSHGAVKRARLERFDVESPDLKLRSQRDTTSGPREFQLSKEKSLSESRLSMRSQAIRKLENIDRSKSAFQIPKRARRANIENDESNDDSSLESEDEDDLPVGSKRSRGVEAPRLSDGQRRLHVQLDAKNSLRTSKQEADDKRRITQRVKRLAMGDASNDATDFATRPFEALTKDQCITVIRGMQEALRRKNVRIWLQGFRLIKAEEVKRTEKDLSQACESGIARAEKLLQWAKRHQGYDSSVGSRFAKMEERAVQECKALIDVYFDRRKVSLREIGCRVFGLTKELPAYSRKLTSVLEELLVLWVDLTSGRS